MNSCEIIMTPKQQSFVTEYLIDKNATQAAIRAGYSKHTAYSQGERLLRNAEIRSAIDAGIAKHAENAGLSIEMVLASIVRELTFDPAQLFDEFGGLKPIDEIPAEARKCLVGIETAQVGSPEAPVMVQKVKWVNPSQAREQAMKHLGMFEKDNAQKPPPVVQEIRLVPLGPKDEDG